MIQVIYAVRDIKTDQFGQPMFLINKGHAVRSFADAVNNNDKDNMLYKHPQDFELYELGQYDTETGIITPNRPTQIITANEVLKATN